MISINVIHTRVNQQTFIKAIDLRFGCLDASFECFHLVRGSNVLSVSHDVGQALFLLAVDSAWGLVGVN